MMGVVEIRVISGTVRKRVSIKGEKDISFHPHCSNRHHFPDRYSP
jgi:hypothetical protein